MSDPFDDVVPSRRGIGEPAGPGAQRQPLEPDRVDLLLAALAEYDDAEYFRREEFFEDNFERLLEEHKLAANWQAKLVQGVSDEVGLLLALRPVEFAPDGPLIGHLLIRWEDAPFATLLVKAPER